MNAVRCAVLGFVGLVVAGCSDVSAQSAVASFDQAFEIDGPVELDVRSGAGRITVRPGSDGNVRVVGRLEVWARRGRSAGDIEELVRRFEAEPPVEISGNLVSVGALADNEYRDLWGHGRVSMSFEIEVPRETRVASRTGSGSQEITGVSGPVRAAAGSGSLVLRDIGGGADLRTGSGSIRAEGIAGPIEASTGSGSVALVQVAPGDVRVSTGSGRADLRGIDGALVARTGSGGIAVDGRQSGAWDLETGSGSVRLNLPEDAAFALDARTGSGRLESSHPVTMQGSVDRGRLSGQVRGGGPLLRVRTGSGSVSID